MQTLIFQIIYAAVRSAFDDQRYSALEQVAGDLRRQILETVPGDLRNNENAIREGIRMRRARAIGQPEFPAAALDQEQAEEILVARELARVGLGIDLLIAQPLTEEMGA